MQQMQRQMVGPHGLPIDPLTGCEEPPGFYDMLSPAATSVPYPGSADLQTTEVLLDGEVGSFAISPKGGFPQTTIKGVYSSALRNKRVFPTTSQFGIPAPQGLNKLHAIRLRHLTVPDNLPNVSPETQNRIYINTMHLLDDFELRYNNFVCEVPRGNYFDITHLLSEVDTALDNLRYNPPTGQTFDSSLHRFIVPRQQFVTVVDTDQNRVAIKNLGTTSLNKRSVVYASDSSFSYVKKDNTIANIDVSTATVFESTFTVRAEETPISMLKQPISGVKQVYVDSSLAFPGITNVTSSSARYLRFVEFQVKSGGHNLAVGDRVELNGVDISGGTTDHLHIAYVKRGTDQMDTLRIYVETDTSKTETITVSSNENDLFITILDRCEKNLAPLLGFRHHTRLGFGCDVSSAGVDQPIFVDEACVIRGGVRTLMDSSLINRDVVFTATHSPLFAIQTYTNSKLKITNILRERDDSNDLDRISNFNVYDGSFSYTSVLYVQGNSIHGFTKKIDGSDYSFSGSNSMRIDAADSSGGDNHPQQNYDHAILSYKNIQEDTSFGSFLKLSNHGITFGTAMANMSHLNHFAYIHLVHNGEQLGSIQSPQNNSGRIYFAKIVLDRAAAGATSRIYNIPGNAIHVFNNPKREVLHGNEEDSSAYVVTVYDQLERVMNLNGEEWDFVLEFVSYR